MIKIVGLTGRNASGKGEVADFLRRRGFFYRSLSDVLRDEAQKRNLEASRETLIALGQELREKGGPGVLAKMTIPKLQSPISVVDSVRNPEEIRFLRQAGTFLLLAVDAPIELRFERAKQRGRNENAESLEKFKEMEDREHSSVNKAQQIDLCLQEADVVILNEGSVEELHQKVENVLKENGFL